MNFLSVLKKEYYIWIPFAVLCFFAGSIALSGLPQGIIPNIKYPFSYGGDIFSMGDIVKKVMEGSVYENARHAFPFGSFNYDYPIPEVGILFIVKLLSFIFDSPFVIMNVLFLITFPLCFISAYGVLRALGLNWALSVSAGVLYVFIPFHFFRLAHLFYTFYFVVPLYFYYGYVIASKAFLEKLSGWKNNKAFLVGHIIALAALASISVYYAFFGMVTIFICGFMGAFYNKTWKSAAAACAACFILLASVAAYTSPVLYYQHTNGKNEEVAVRHFVESEIYGLKMIQLLLPSPQHRLAALGNKTREYNGHAPLITENWTSTMGLIASVGFVCVLIYIFIIVSGGGKAVFLRKAVFAVRFRPFTVFICYHRRYRCHGGFFGLSHDSGA